MSAKDKLVGIYLGASEVLRNPGYLEMLRDKLGLNMVILGFAGQLPDAVRATSPFDGVPVSDARLHELLCQHIDGVPAAGPFDGEKQCIGPNVGMNGDDTELRAGIAAARRVGLQVWLLSGGWTVHDFDVLMYCPSEPTLYAWFEALYTHLATAYGVDGLDITHARYIMTSHPRGLGLCACARCARAAADFGYDMGQMVADLRDAVERVKRANPVHLVEVCTRGLGPMDLMQFLGLRPGVMQWFDLRCRIMGRNMARLREAVHRSAGPKFIFGTDTYPASLSLLAGHNHARFGEFSDFASPLLSHVDIFPMETTLVWAQWLRRLQPEISEVDALLVACRLAGYDGLEMPRTFADFRFGGRALTPDWRGEPDCEWRHNPLRAMLRLDMTKAKLYLPAGLPCYPIIQGGGAPHNWPREIIEGVMQDAFELGHDGVILQGTTQLVDYRLRS
jgi:hypothetical protein